MSVRRLALAAAFMAACLAARAQQIDASENPWSQSLPGPVGRELFANSQYDTLEALAKRLVANRERMVDGRYQIDLLEGGIEDTFSAWSTDSPGAAARHLAEWKKKSPASSYRPVIEAISLRNDAWKARGDGLASRVRPEDFARFRDLDGQAWKVLMDARKPASAYPGWYAAAIGVGFELDKSRKEIDALFDEGMTRFPGQLSLYFSYLHYLQPKWGGSFEEMDQFIRREVASRNNTHGEALYARMYWFVDQCDECARENYFEVAKLDWPRMRKSFDALLRQFPQSQRNVAAFADFACRARDAATYRRLRARVQPDVFGMLAHQPLEECDSRLK
jgi:ferritin